MTKKELRAAMKHRNLELTGSRRSEASARIFAAVERLPAFAAAHCIALYCALGDEPETQPLFARWPAAGKRLIVPRVEGEEMNFYDYDSAGLVSGAFGIAEPGPEAQPCDPHRIDLLVVPGVAFTAAGDRLGRGRGYYDTYLSRHGMRAVKVGVCYRHQVVGELPVEPHDVKMDILCTDL